MSTEYAVPSTEYRVPSTRRAFLCSADSVLGTLYCVLGTRYSVLLAFLFLTSPLQAAELPFLVHTADDKALEGTLRELGADWSVRLEKGETIAAGALLSLRRPEAGLPPLPEGTHLILTNGDRIPAEDVRLAGERVRFRHRDLNDGKEISLPLSSLAVYWRESPSGSGAEAERRRLLHGSRTRDLVLLLNGDVVEGSLNGINDKGVEVEVGKKRVTVELNRVAAVALSSELADRTRPRDVYARVALTAAGRPDGTRLSLTKATCSDGATLTGTTVFGATLSVPLGRVAALDLFQGKAVYLSDLKPAKEESESFLDVRWPLVVDGSASGHELRLGDGVYDKGLGMHPRTRISYRLDGGYRRFEAVVGLDPRTGRDGGARVRVLADGKPLDLGPERELTGRTAPLTIFADVTGAKELTLEVDYGRRGDVQAHVNWVDARLIRESPPR